MPSTSIAPRQKLVDEPNPRLTMDLDDDKISDYLLSSNDPQSSIIIFESEKYIPQMSVYAGISVEKILPDIPAVVLDLTHEQIVDISDHEGVRLIESNSKLIPQLYHSTAQLGVRNSIWDLGYTGPSNMSIAIVDSGIDATHTGFQDRIVASFNAITNTQTATDDDVGHGTHVAGIAAGLPELSTTGFDTTTRGTLPDPSNYGIAFSLSNVDETTDLEFVFDWGQDGNDIETTIAGIAAIDITNQDVCDTCYLSDNDGLLKGSISIPPGEYLIGVFGSSASDSNQNEGDPYELTILAPYVDDIAITNPTISNYAGVAYETNLVDVKVTDQDLNGDVSTFVDAIDWIIENRKTYNITVVNLSIGVDALSLTIDKKVEQMANKGLVSVVAVGNEGSQATGIYSPASSPYALSVGAVGRSNEVAFYSSKGTKSTNSEVIKPDVLAPGGSSASTILGFNTITEEGYAPMVSLDANGIGFDVKQNDLSLQEGTSMATPHISGLAVLMASKLASQSGWDWDSASSVIEVKRMILSSTFEVGNIGYGREEFPSGGYSGNAPTIDHGMKDYQEGWGAVDARAVFSLMQEQIEIGKQYTMKFDLLDVFSQHVYGWKMTATAEQGYGFSLSIPDGVDADILIIDAETGPLIDGNDYGDLNVLQYSSSGLGQDENVGFISDQDTDIYVVVRVVDGASNDDLMLEVIELDYIPQIDITSPKNGEYLDSSSVTIEFTSTSSEVNAFLNGDNIGKIRTGYVLSNLSEGEYELILEESVDIFKIRKSVTFIIDLTDSQSENTNPLPPASIWMTMVLAITVLLRLYPRQGRS